MSSNLSYLDALKSIQLLINKGDADPASLCQALLNALSIIRSGKARSSDANAANITDDFFLTLIQLFQLEMKLVFMPSLSQTLKNNESAKGLFISSANGNISVSIRRLLYAVVEGFLSEAQPSTSLGFMITNTLVNEVSKSSDYQGHQYEKYVASQFDLEKRALGTVIEYNKGLSMRILRRIAHGVNTDTMIDEIALPPTLIMAIHRAICMGGNRINSFPLSAIITVLFSIENNRDQSITELQKDLHGSGPDFHKDLLGILDDPNGYSEELIALSLVAVFQMKTQKTTDTLVYVDDRESMNFLSHMIKNQGKVLSNASEQVNNIRLISLSSSGQQTSGFSSSESRSSSFSAVSLLPLIRIVRDTFTYGSYRLKFMSNQNVSMLRHFLVGCLCEEEDFIVLEAAKGLLEIAEYEKDTHGKCPEYLVLGLHALQRNLKIYRTKNLENRSVDDCAYATVLSSLTLITDILCIWKNGVPPGIIQDLDELTIRALPFFTTTERTSIDFITSIIVNSSSLLVKLIRRVVLHISFSTSSAEAVSAAENGANIVRLGLSTLIMRGDAGFRQELSDLFHELAQHGKKLINQNELFLRLFTGILFDLLDDSAPFASRVLVVETIKQLLDSVSHMNTAQSMLPSLIQHSLRIMIKLIEESTEIENQGSSEKLVASLTSNLEKLAASTLTEHTRTILSGLRDASSHPPTDVDVPEDPFQTSTGFHYDCINDSLLCLARYILLHTEPHAKTRGFHALFRIALAFTPHCFAKHNCWPNLPQKIQRIICDVAHDMQQASWANTHPHGGPSLCDSETSVEAKVVANLIEHGYNVLKEIAETRCVPKSTGLQLLQCIHSFGERKSTEVEPPTFEVVNNISSCSQDVDSSSTERYDREKIGRVVGRDIQMLRRARPIMVTPADGTSQERFHEYQVAVTPIFSERYLILEYEITNKIGGQESATELLHHDMVDVKIKISTSEENWLVDDHSIQDTSVTRIGPEETGRILVCIPLNSGHSMESIRHPPKFQHVLLFSQDEPGKSPTQRNEIRSFHLPAFVLPFESIVGSDPSLLSKTKGTIEQSLLDELSHRWKSLEPPMNSKSSEYELKTLYKFDTLTNIRDIVASLSSHTELAIVPDPKEHAVKKSEGQMSGYFLVWMCGSFLPEVVSSPIMLRCKFAFSLSGTAVCQLTVRGMNPDVRAQLCEEIFDRRLSCVNPKA